MKVENEPTAETPANSTPHSAVVLGARVKNIVGQGEVSAHGLVGEIGVVLVQVPVGSVADKAGLQEGDVILRCLDQEIRGVDELFKTFGDAPKGTRITLGLWRLQQHASVEVGVE